MGRGPNERTNERHSATAASRHRPPPSPSRRVQGVYAGAAARRVFWTRHHGTRVIRFFSGKTRASPTAADTRHTAQQWAPFTCVLASTITRPSRLFAYHFCRSQENRFPRPSDQPRSPPPEIHDSHRKQSPPTLILLLLVIFYFRLPSRCNVRRRQCCCSIHGTGPRHDGPSGLNIMLTAVEVHKWSTWTARKYRSYT